MVLTKKMVSSLAWLLLTLVLCSPAHAQRRPAADRAGLDLDQTVQMVRSRVSGRVLSAETRNMGGREVHSIRVLTRNGKVRRFRIDASTGRQLNKKPARR